MHPVGSRLYVEISLDGSWLPRGIRMPQAMLSNGSSAVRIIGFRKRVNAGQLPHSRHQET